MMRQDLLKKILFVCYCFNIAFILIQIFIIAAIIVSPSEMFHHFKSQNDNLYIRIFYFLLTIPILFLWIYNIRFAYKNDKYSKALLFLFIFQIYYSPYYYYQIKYNKRKLINNIENEQVLDRIIFIEEYNSEQDLKKDLDKLNK